MSNQRWALLVVWRDGTEEYVKEGLGTSVAQFTRAEAVAQKDFLMMGMDQNECQSINVVRAPGKRKTA